MRINLKDYYKEYYNQDYFVDVPEEVAFWLKELDLMERRWQEKMLYHFSTIYSLDREDGMEHQAIQPPLSAEKEYEKDLLHRKLNHALEQLTPMQAKRIYQHCVLGYSYTKIAAYEEVNESSIRESIKKGLSKLKKYF